MSITTLKGPSVMSQIGGNLGQSLAEQLPQEVGRQRLAYALKGMQGQNLSPIDQAQKLLASGGSMQDIAAMLPILQQSQTKRVLEQQAKEGNGIMPSVEGRQTAEQIPQSQGRFASPEQLQKMTQTIPQKPTKGQIARRALEIGGDLKQAQIDAKDELDTLANDWQGKNNQFRKLVNDQYENIFHTQGIKDFGGSPLSGKNIEWFLKQGDYRQAQQNATPEDAARQTIEDMQDYAQRISNAKQSANKWSLFSSANDKMSGILPEREAVKQYGPENLNQFDKSVISEMQISPDTYYDQVSPITDKSLKSELRSTVHHIKDSSKLAYFNKNVIPKIQPTDNPQSILKELIRYQPGGHFLKNDPSPFLAAMKIAQREGRIHFNEENKRILNDFQTNKPNYHDLLFDQWR